MEGSPVSAPLPCYPNHECTSAQWLKALKDGIDPARFKQGVVTETPRSTAVQEVVTKTPTSVQMYLELVGPDLAPRLSPFPGESPESPVAASMMTAASAATYEDTHQGHGVPRPSADVASLISIMPEA